MTQEVMNPTRPFTKDGDAYRCQCGSYEWETCDKEGKLQEPVQSWEGHYKCCSCGSVQPLLVSFGIKGVINAVWNNDIPEEYVEQIWEEYHTDFCDKDCMCREDVGVDKEEEV